MCFFGVCVLVFVCFCLSLCVCVVVCLFCVEKNRRARAAHGCKTIHTTVYTHTYTYTTRTLHKNVQDELQQARAALRDAKRQMGNMTRPKRRYDQVCPVLHTHIH